MALEFLPEHLRERSRIFEPPRWSFALNADSFVLYWMRTAVRTDENPALDLALLLARHHDLPLLVYQAISEHYPYSSDRHHWFMLQGARDVQQQCAASQISYAFHLATREDRRPHLVTLANLASVVVTEDMPVDPARSFLHALSYQTETPIVCVDTACVAPMQWVKQSYTRAFEFRSATQRLYAERLTRSWPEQKGPVKPFDRSRLPFADLDLRSADLAELISRCEIDHAIGPVVDSVGGSEAGYRRWDAFKQNGLKHYAKVRNNALQDGVSRLSPYLHYGMVSPFRIAREAAKCNHEGSEKFLDELLIWRELAYAFCFYRKDHDAWSALPEWAQQTLTQHSSDPRPHVYSWEQLARGETDDKLWNAAQQSLLRNGELHNNLRMTWGKAILNWTRSPQDALATIIDLNHRYALDGRDPASYGGILWCLGQFDRPFTPEQKVIGTVRPRPTAEHALRLNSHKYLAQVMKPRFDPILRVAVLGAGISGLFAARTLQDHGLQVTVFEKSRGVGGRMATRRTDSSATFDHGAQYFTARDPRFIRYVKDWIEQGIVAAWPDPSLGADQRIVVLKRGAIESVSDSEDRFVAVPTMNSICKHLSAGLEIQTKCPITNVVRGDDGVELLGKADEPLGRFDRFVVSAPAAQAAVLLADFPVLAAQISAVEMNPCWAVMAAFPRPITSQWAGAFLHDSFLAWAARNSTKPGRNRNTEHLILHASPDWTAANWDRPPDAVAQEILAEFWPVAGIAPIACDSLQAHRWKFAIPVAPALVGCFADPAAAVVCCGDWAKGSRVEGAFLSGMSAAGRILATLSPAQRQSDDLGQRLLFE